MMPVIHASYAWRRIRDARAGDLGDGANGLYLTPSGGWEIADGVEIADEACQLLDVLLPVACAGSSWVIAQIGQSLDGRIATASGHSHYVTGEASRAHLHRLRALVDAVVVGVGTVDADDPQLTVRHVRGDNPVRVVLDPSGRVRRDRRLFAGADASTLHLVAAGAPPLAGAERVELAVDEQGRFAPGVVCAALAERGLGRLLIEGGGVCISSFVAAGCVDRLHCVVAPFLIGSGRPALALPEIATLDDALRPAVRDFPLGDDRLYDLDLRGGPA